MNSTKASNSLLRVDYLTGFDNRKGAYDYYSRLDKNNVISILYFDIDDFEKINELYGYTVGDNVIILVGDLIGKFFQDDYIARLEGDRFVVITTEKNQDNIIKKVEETLKEVKDVNLHQHIFSEITLSVGLVFEQNTCQNFDDVLAKCSLALYKVKSKGKSQYVVYDNGEEEELINRKIEREMEEALKNGEFVVYFQPKVNGVINRLVGAEALVRWIHPVEGIRSPAKFIPLFEKNGFIAKLDLYVFEEVCRAKQMMKTMQNGDIVISVNMSRMDIFNDNIPSMLMEIANNYDIPANELEIEITESAFIQNKDQLINIIMQLRKLGFHVSIDDFGSGYSSLSMLSGIPVNVVKLDREFIRMSTDTKKGRKVLKNVINMCRDLKYEVITEGVETQEELSMVIDCGCQNIQGYFYSKPLPFKEFEDFISQMEGIDTDDVNFTFDGILESENNEFAAFYVPSEKNPGNYTFEEGIFRNTKALHLPGGDKGENLICIPHIIIAVESYTISLWVKAEEILTWGGVFYIKYEAGFVELVQKNDDGAIGFRERDSKELTGWYDISGSVLEKNKWTHMAISYDADNEVGKIYINGKLLGCMAEIPPLRYIKLLYMGGDVFQPSPKASYCHLKICRVLKTDKEIEDLYKSYVERDDFIG